MHHLIAFLAGRHSLGPFPDFVGLPSEALIRVACVILLRRMRNARSSFDCSQAD
jgi:hypothetical protein